MSFRSDLIRGTDGAAERYKIYTGVGKSRFAVVRMEKDMQVMIITIVTIIIRQIRRKIIQINNTIINK